MYCRKRIEHAKPGGPADCISAVVEILVLSKSPYMRTSRTQARRLVPSLPDSVQTAPAAPPHRDTYCSSVQVAWASNAAACVHVTYSVLMFWSNTQGSKSLPSWADTQSWKDRVSKIIAARQVSLFLYFVVSIAKFGSILREALSLCGICISVEHALHSAHCNPWLPDDWLWHTCRETVSTTFPFLPATISKLVMYGLPVASSHPFESDRRGYIQIG